MKTIRNNVFETNSSSMHSFTIADTPIGDNAGVTLEFYANGEYGWGGDTVNTPDTLLDYAGVAFSCIVESKKEWNQAVKNVIKYFKTRGVTIINKVSYDAKDEWNHVPGYIDHQSGPWEDDECQEIANMFYNPETLYNFVFGNSEIIIDNDNH